MSGTDVRVVVVDDQQLIRESIAALLNLQPGITVVGTAGDGVEAIEAVKATRPDVILMDVRMPRMDGVTAAVELRLIAPESKILMLTTFDDESYVRGAIQGGAAGYLLKDRPADEIAAAIRTAHLGLAQLDPSALARLLQSPASTVSFDTTLSERELQVLRLISGGATNREIARDLHLSEGTVKNHVSRILERLGVRHRTEAAVFAREHGMY